MRLGSVTVTVVVTDSGGPLRGSKTLVEDVPVFVRSDPSHTNPADAAQRSALLLSCATGTGQRHFDRRHLAGEAPNRRPVTTATLRHHS